MPLSPNINEREFDKFGLNKDDETIVKTSASGEFSSSGVKIGWRNIVVSVGDTAVKLPVFTDRNASTLHNKSTTDILYIGPDDTVTADTVVGSTSGMEIAPRNKANFDIKDIDENDVDIDIWAIAPAGITILVKITDLA